MLWQWVRENQPQSDTACWNSMIRFVHKIDSICDVTKRGGMLVKGHFSGEVSVSQTLKIIVSF